MVKSRLLPVERPQCPREIRTKSGGEARAPMHSKAKQSTRGEIRTAYELAIELVILRFCTMSLNLYLYIMVFCQIKCSMNLMK